MKAMDVFAVYRKIPSEGNYGPPEYQLFALSYDRKGFPFLSKDNPGSELIFVKGPEEKLKVVLTYKELNELERLN